MSPLAGKRIVITRPRAQAAELMDRLSSLGAVPIAFPTIELMPMEDYSALDRAIERLGQYGWVVFTSVNGVAAFWRRLAVAGKDGSQLLGRSPSAAPRPRVAAIGPATAKALAKRGVSPEYVPDEYVAERILDGVGDVNGQWVLLPRADIAREALAVELGRRGAVVHEIAAYRTLPAAPDPQGLAELRRGVDAVTFTSSSTVRNFLKLLDDEAATVLHRAAIACIGPITAQTLRESGLGVDVMAERYTVDGLVEVLEKRFA